MKSERVINDYEFFENLNDIIQLFILFQSEIAIPAFISHLDLKMRNLEDLEQKQVFDLLNETAERMEEKLLSEELRNFLEKFRDISGTLHKNMDFTFMTHVLNDPNRNINISMKITNIEILSHYGYGNRAVYTVYGENIHSDVEMDVQIVSPLRVYFQTVGSRKQQGDEDLPKQRYWSISWKDNPTGLVLHDGEKTIEKLQTYWENLVPNENTHVTEKINKLKLNMNRIYHMEKLLGKSTVKIIIANIQKRKYRSIEAVLHDFTTVYNEYKRIIDSADLDTTRPDGRDIAIFYHKELQHLLNIVNKVTELQHNSR
jgi:hypothetical protein